MGRGWQNEEKVDVGKKGGGTDNSRIVEEGEMEKASRFQQMTRPAQKTGNWKDKGRE